MYFVLQSETMSSMQNLKWAFAEIGTIRAGGRARRGMSRLWVGIDLRGIADT
jgi:hypothetical protein